MFDQLAEGSGLTGEVLLVDDLHRTLVEFEQDGVLVLDAADGEEILGV